jgi:hypothetical protein
MSDGHLNKCKECTKKAVKNNYRKRKRYYQNYDRYRQKYNIMRIFNHRYSGMKTRVNGNGSHAYSVVGKKICSKTAFVKWCLSPKIFITFQKIYLAWKKAGFPKKLSPSIDRIDNTKGYELNNLQWLTHQDNSSKHIN